MGSYKTVKGHEAAHSTSVEAPAKVPACRKWGWTKYLATLLEVLAARLVLRARLVPANEARGRGL